MESSNGISTHEDQKSRKQVTDTNRWQETAESEEPIGEYEEDGYYVVEIPKERTSVNNVPIQEIKSVVGKLVNQQGVSLEDRIVPSSAIVYKHAPETHPTGKGHGGNRYNEMEHVNRQKEGYEDQEKRLYTSINKKLWRTKREYLFLGCGDGKRIIDFFMELYDCKSLEELHSLRDAGVFRHKRIILIDVSPSLLDRAKELINSELGITVTSSLGDFTDLNRLKDTHGLYNPGFVSLGGTIGNMNLDSLKHRMFHHMTVQVQQRMDFYFITNANTDIGALEDKYASNEEHDRFVMGPAGAVFGYHNEHYFEAIHECHGMARKPIQKVINGNEMVNEDIVNGARAMGGFRLTEDAVNQFPQGMKIRIFSKENQEWEEFVFVPGETYFCIESRRWPDAILIEAIESVTTSKQKEGDIRVVHDKESGLRSVDVWIKPAGLKHWDMWLAYSKDLLQIKYPHLARSIHRGYSRGIFVLTVTIALLLAQIIRESRSIEKENNTAIQKLKNIELKENNRKLLTQNFATAFEGQMKDDVKILEDEVCGLSQEIIDVLQETGKLKTDSLVNYMFASITEAINLQYDVKRMSAYDQEHNSDFVNTTVRTVWQEIMINRQNELRKLRKTLLNRGIPGNEIADRPFPSDQTLHTLDIQKIINDMFEEGGITKDLFYSTGGFNIQDFKRRPESRINKSPPRRIES